MAGSMVGRIFNERYEITERVGLGGMAEVYRAQDHVLGRMVAVKVMLPQYAADPTFTQRFRQEAASAARLQSPYIVNIYDWGLDGETYYIVMEYLRGTDLKTAIKERGYINQRKAAEIGSQVAQALSVAHAANIIHRDIKPQNIMIQPDGNIKVMDFGIARAGDAGLSQTATVLGTAHYVSPEQAQGRDLTPASDIYSLGIVLYEAVTGRLPFEGQDAVSVAVKQVNEIPAPPSLLKPDIDPALEAIIMKAMEKDPSRRFANATEMRHCLNDYLAGRPVNLGTGAGMGNMKTQVMGGVTAIPPIGAAGGTVAMPNVGGQNNMAAAGATKPVATNYTNRQQQQYRQQEEPQKKKPIAGIILGIVAALAIAVGAFMFLGKGEMVDVPDVTGMTIEEARSELNEAGFKLGNQTQVYSEEVEVGKVVSTNPPAGQQAEKGSAIDVNVSKGTEEIVVPDVKDMTVDEAKKTLTAAGLNPQEGDKVYSSEVEEGRVASQDTIAGKPAKKGDTVVFHVSKGEENVSVPNVVGTTKSNAESSLKSAGFKVSVSYEDSTSVEEGRVISQSPTGEAGKGSTVTIVVSNGSGTNSVPNVVGMYADEAISQLESAGFGYSVKEVASSAPTNQVINQSVSGTAAKGTVVTIEISLGEANAASAE